MDLKKIKQIVTSDLDSGEMEYAILECLSDDPNVIPAIMTILALERDKNMEIRKDMNILLSKADTIMENPKLNKDRFANKEIAEFYKKYKGTKGIFHAFNPQQTFSSSVINTKKYAKF